MTVYTPDSSRVKFLGRTTPTENGLWLCWSGAGAEFSFTGRECSITILGDERSEEPETRENHARIAIEVNGERVITGMIDQKIMHFQAVKSGEIRNWSVRIIKLSESAMATCVLSEIAADGELCPTPAKAHSIEFIGDSITCGYGIDDPVAEHPFHTSTEDVTQAYAYLAAGQLQADYSMVCLSGYGIISGYTGNGFRCASQLIPDYYEKVGFCFAPFAVRKPQELDWNFSAFAPELVVINLGTNDDSYTGDDPLRQREYCKEYQRFLQTVRKRNPRAKILCTLGMMGDRLYPTLEEAVSEYCSATGDTEITAFHFVPQTDEDGYSSDWHPSRLTQQRAADALTGFVRKWLGW